VKLFLALAKDSHPCLSQQSGSERKELWFEGFHFPRASYLVF